jgi:hypothetical protein
MNLIGYALREFDECECGPRLLVLPEGVLLDICQVVASWSIFPLQVLEVQKLEHILRHNKPSLTSLEITDKSIDEEFLCTIP